jgi:protein involved in sex pheromone biosynthesis
MTENIRRQTRKMKILKISIVAIFIFLSASIAFAQDTDAKMKDMSMKDKTEMSEMMKSPQQKVMMAYHQNILTFAKTLRDLAKDSENLDSEFAKTMVSEIKRSSEMMDKIHKDHMSKMNPEKMEKMAPMMEKMKKQKAELDEHIKALEKSVESALIDKKEFETHASAIVEMLESEKMDEMHKDKMKMDMKDM